MNDNLRPDWMFRHVQTIPAKVLDGWGIAGTTRCRICLHQSLLPVAQSLFHYVRMSDHHDSSCGSLCYITFIRISVLLYVTFQHFPLFPFKTSVKWNHYDIIVDCEGGACWANQIPWYPDDIISCSPWYFGDQSEKTRQTISVNHSYSSNGIIVIASS